MRGKWARDRLRRADLAESAHDRAGTRETQISRLSDNRGKLIGGKERV